MGTVDGTVRLISEIVFTFLEGIEIIVPGTSCPVNPSSAVWLISYTKKKHFDYSKG
jgi:hypothetical protein